MAQNIIYGGSDVTMSIDSNKYLFIRCKLSKETSSLNIILQKLIVNCQLTIDSAHTCLTLQRYKKLDLWNRCIAVHPSW